MNLFVILGVKQGVWQINRGFGTRFRPDFAAQRARFAAN